MAGLIQHVLDGVTSWHLSRKVKSGAVLPLPDARYESAFPFFRKRSYVPGTIQDARLDASPGVRRELLKNSRYWERNSAYANKLIDLFEAFTVGSNGLHIVPSSSDEDWNEAAAEWWKNWCEQPARDNFQPLGQLQSLAARAWFTDGEIFLNLTSDPSTGRPAFQLVESHRIETPGDKGMYEGNGITDGVETDEAGRPTAYYIRQRDTSSFYGQNSLMAGAMQSNYSTPGTYARVNASNIIHIFEPVRAGLTRGLPMLYAVERDLHDLDDLQDLEMQKAKENARTAKVVKTKTGEAPSTANAYRQKYSTQTQDAAGNSVAKNMPQFYEITQGGDVIYMQPNEEMQEFRSETPSAATQAYWETLIGKVCVGTGIPRVLVVPYSIQGTVLRADIETAAAFFRARSAVVGHSMHQLYKWAMGWAVEHDRTLKRDTPKDWANVVVRPPRSVNVDVGRNSSALINEMNAGIRSLAQVCSELGVDWREVLRQRAIEWAYAQKISAKTGVPIERIMELPKPPTPPPAPSDASEAEAHFRPKISGNGHHRLQLV
jgi:lambda family phage portal protein